MAISPYVVEGPRTTFHAFLEYMFPDIRIPSHKIRGYNSAYLGVIRAAWLRMNGRRDGILEALAGFWIGRALES